MSSARVTDKSNDGRSTKEAPSQVQLPKGQKKFKDSETASDQFEVVIEGGEVMRRASKSFAPIRLFSDPLHYWEQVVDWATKLGDEATKQVDALENFVYTPPGEFTDEGECITLHGKSARQRKAKDDRAEYNRRKSIERATKDSDVHQHIASNAEALGSVLDAMTPEAMAAFLAMAQAKLEEGEEGEVDES